MLLTHTHDAEPFLKAIEHANNVLNPQRRTSTKANTSSLRASTTDGGDDSPAPAKTSPKPITTAVENVLDDDRRPSVSPHTVKKHLGEGGAEKTDRRRSTTAADVSKAKARERASSEEEDGSGVSSFYIGGGGGGGGGGAATLAMARQIDGLKTELRELKAAMQEQGERFDELIEHLRGSNNL